MNSARLNDWIEIVGIFSLVASLVFVGLQIRQAQEIAESEVYQARAAISVEFNAMKASSPEFTSAISKIYAGHSGELSDQEKVSLEYFFSADMTIYENLHYQYESGYLSKEHWDKNLNELRCMLSLPYFREVVSYNEYRESFRSVIDKMTAEVVSKPSDCWE